MIKTMTRKVKEMMERRTLDRAVPPSVASQWSVSCNSYTSGVAVFCVAENAAARERVINNSTYCNNLAVQTQLPGS